MKKKKKKYDGPIISIKGKTFVTKQSYVSSVKIDKRHGGYTEAESRGNVGDLFKELGLNLTELFLEYPERDLWVFDEKLPIWQKIADKSGCRLILIKRGQTSVDPPKVIAEFDPILED